MGTCKIKISNKLSTTYMSQEPKQKVSRLTNSTKKLKGGLFSWTKCIQFPLKATTSFFLSITLLIVLSYIGNETIKNLSFVFYFISVLAFTFMLYKFLEPAFNFWSSMRNIVIITNPEAEKIKEFASQNVTKFYLDNHYQYRRYNDELILFSSEVDYYLFNNADTITLNIINRMEPLPDGATYFLARNVNKKISEGKDIYNNNFVKLCDDLGLNTKSVTVRKTDYYTNISTNDAIDSCARLKGKASLYIEGKNFSINKNGKLYDLKHSTCANIVGASTLAITSDNKVVISKQGWLNDVNNGKYVPSGSGSADYDDLKISTHTFSCFLKKAMERELKEELHLNNQTLKINTIIISYLRLLNRGGKPDFFGISRICATSDEIKKIHALPVDNNHKTNEVDSLVFLNPTDLYDEHIFAIISKEDMSVQLISMIETIKRYKNEHDIELFTII
ncbi:MAG: hypothetical protein FWC33_01475 [Candidatus Bathyarchaeota archaeon]|nr:hypothetical protein [Candidatus Termiticorpusculum sp.]